MLSPEFFISSRMIRLGIFTSLPECDSSSLTALDDDAADIVFSQK